MKKFFIILGVAAILGVGSFLFVKKVSAADGNSQFPPMIQKLVDTFNLDPDEVESTLENFREEEKQERIDELIENGEITEEEAQIWEEKHEEMASEIQAVKDDDSLSFDEQREQIREIQDKYREIFEDLDLPLGEMGMRGERDLGFGEGPRF
jgi:competence protein ComGC